MDFDIYVLTETWLSRDISNTELDFKVYVIFRYNGYSSNSNGSRWYVLIVVMNFLIVISAFLLLNVDQYLYVYFYLLCLVHAS